MKSNRRNISTRRFTSSSSGKENQQIFFSRSMHENRLDFTFVRRLIFIVIVAFLFDWNHRKFFIEKVENVSFYHCLCQRCRGIWDLATNWRRSYDNLQFSLLHSSLNPNLTIFLILSEIERKRKFDICFLDEKLRHQWFELFDRFESISGQD